MSLIQFKPTNNSIILPSGESFSSLLQ